MKRSLYILVLLLPAFVQAQSIHITTPHDNICNGSLTHFTATASGILSPHYHWKKNSSSIGTDSIGYTTSVLNNGDTIKCLLTNSVGDTFFATSNSIVMTVQTMPNAGTIYGTDTVACPGITKVLYDSTPGGVWTSLNGYVHVVNGSITSSGHAGGNDKIYYIVSNSCGRDTASRVVSLGLLPEHYLTFGYPLPTSFICVGEATMAMSGLDPYPGMLYSMHGFSKCLGITIQAISPGDEVIMGVDATECGTDTAYASLRISAPPASVMPILSSSSALCVGATAWLADSSKGQFKWSVSNDNLSINAAGMVTAFYPGQTTVTLQLSNSCGSSTTSTVISVLPPYPIIGSKAICGNDTIHLAEQSTGGTWSSKYNLENISPNGDVTPKATGEDVIWYSMPNGCTVTINVTMNAMPKLSPGDGIVCIGNMITLSADNIATWTSLNTNVATISVHGEVTGLAGGFATITYALASGCFDSVSIHVVDCTPEISVFPNPTLYETIIETDTTLYYHYELFDATGRELYSGDLTGSITRLDTKLLAGGIYMLRVSGPDRSYYGKLVKE
jgi:hypothetical protein